MEAESSDTIQAEGLSNVILLVSNDNELKASLATYIGNIYELLITEDIEQARIFHSKYKPIIAILDLNICKGIECEKDPRCFEIKSVIDKFNEAYTVVYMILSDTQKGKDEIDKRKKIADIVLSRPVNINDLVERIHGSVRFRKLEEDIVAQERMLNLFEQVDTFSDAELSPFEIKNTAMGLIKQFRDFTQNILKTERQKTKELEISLNKLKQLNEKLIVVLAELQEHMAKAGEIQRCLLPQGPLQMQDVKIQGLLKAAKDVGGDYYDIISHSIEKAGGIIADVSGKGVDAGMVMSMVKTIFHLLLKFNINPKDIILNLNSYLCHQVGRQKFVTLAYVEYSAGDKTFILSGAGHEHFIVARDGKDGEREVDAILTGGVLLGVFDNIEDEISQQYVTLNKGDKIILYTDGVTEIKNSNNEMFGLQRLIETIKTAPTLSTEEFLPYILDRLEQFRGNAEQYDDITLLVFDKLS